MKKIIKITTLLTTLGVLFTSCKKFEEINNDPLAASLDQVQVEYFINGSIIGTQMDPHIAERTFVLYWQCASHQSFQGTSISGGIYNDGWSSDYYGNGYMSGWLNQINSAVQVAESKIASGNVKPYTNNLLQVARIWRAYLMSELSDNFGPIPINAFQGVNPQPASVKDVYYFLLEELKDASSKLDVSVVNPDVVKKEDPVYSYDYAKWRRYANSMRLRLAMRLSEIDPGKAKTEFEAAATGELITDADQTFQISEKPGWDALTGVMSREWNPGRLSATLKNLYTGLGGITSADQLDAKFDPYIKAADYVGIKYANHFSPLTNDPTAAYWLDGLPNMIDPRAYKTFIIPGDFSRGVYNASNPSTPVNDPNFPTGWSGNSNFNSYPSWDQSAITTVHTLTDASSAVVATVDAKFTYNAYTGGDWGAIGSTNNVRADGGSIPRMANQFRNSTNKRIFFAAWETYFLLAEAAVRGWSVPMGAQSAYEEGVRKSFEYWGVESFLASYLSSTNYNRCGTSVSWTHTTEPAATLVMNYVDGYTNTPGVVNISYPTNNLYSNGTVKNDLLSKIITQKYLAQVPWLPLEGWNDQRRLGLPFLENPVIENALPNLPALTSSTYMTSDVKFFPQRLKYPSSLRNSNEAGYNAAVALLGGPDEVLTPLWWAKH